MSLWLWLWGNIIIIRSQNFHISIYIIRVAEQWESLCSQAKILNLHLRLILKNTGGKNEVNSDFPKLSRN